MIGDAPGPSPGPSPGLVARVRGAWIELAGPGAEFPDAPDAPVAHVPVAQVLPDARLAPPGWVGVVSVGGRLLVAAPDAAVADRFAAALAAHGTADPLVLARHLPPQDVLGPAALAYAEEPPTLRRAAVAVRVEEADREEGVDLAARVDPAEAEEAGLDGVTSALQVVRDGGRVVAAAGWRAWPADLAHVSVLVAPEARGRGAGQAVGAAAVADALATGRLVQWRAREPASRGIARAIGLREVGHQVSLRV